ncbi:PASTA domain-containing protein [Dactylosporangium sucinum]|uniref:PASTA domain-containing protein n=1 Tax=Dactylosporangium sucinum TaxID=1424081 RepID=A0A917U2L2_9ACTN|nr:PASTA domain-containing protein [Dactylosporangium sucinum]GGM50738.1 hypothetical protein GCM10007977_060610 [Dactylosporangium sucinum]
MPQSPDDDRREGRPDDATQPYRPPTDPWEESASTEERWAEPHQPPGPETPPYGPVSGAPEETAPHRPVSGAPGPGDTTPYRPVPAEPDTERWTARANVRQPAPEEWVEEEDPYQGRSWFTPVIVGIVGLLLFGGLSVGLFLIYRATENGANAPVAPGPAPTAAGSPAPSPTPEPSSAPPPTSGPPATSAAPPAGPVTVPRLRGDSLAEATVKLQALGLDVAVERRADDSLPPGEVLATRPDEGETVQPGGTVTVVVATAPTSSPSPATSAS